MLNRALYLTFYVLYLITLAIAIFFVLHYSGVPSWVWTFFGVGLLILMLAVLVKEFFMKRIITNTGRDITTGSHTFWSVMYILMVLAGIVLLIIGLIFTIQYSSIPWWVWLVLALAIILSIIGNAILAFAPGAFVVAIIMGVLSLILFIVGLILLIIHSNSPWWVWLIVGLAVLFAILAAIFEGLSDKNTLIVMDPCCETTTQVVTTGTVLNVAPTPHIHVQPVVDPSLLPSVSTAPLGI